MAKTQCWEFMKCGRDKDLSCPAVVQAAGMSCWLVAGTLCGGKAQGEYAQKVTSCKECVFYKKVKGNEV